MFYMVQKNGQSDFDHFHCFLNHIGVLKFKKLSYR